MPQSLDWSRVRALPMRNPLLSQGRVEVVTRQGRMLSLAARGLLAQIVDDIGSGAGSLRSRDAAVPHL
jgi:hypothetical protein